MFSCVPEKCQENQSIEGRIKNGLVIFLSQQSQEMATTMKKNARQMATKVATSMVEINTAIQIVDY